jgi:hypothetical protein
MPSTFKEFLQRNTIQASKTLPLVHTTSAYHLQHIWRSGILRANKCDVFVNEKLNYFFVGRPSYKQKNNGHEAEHWQLPACFIVEFDSVSDLKRIFPFDSGALYNSLYPDYISMMNKGNFELPGDAAIPSKIIGAFFGEVRDYFLAKPKEDAAFAAEFSLGAFDDEIFAYHKLARTKSPEKYDDRRCAIEIQSGSDFLLKEQKLIAVVCPTVYLAHDDFRSHVENVWKAEPISCDLFSLSYDHYMYAIYERVKILYEQKGML